MTHRAVARCGEYPAMARAETTFAEGSEAASAMIAPPQSAGNAADATRQWHHFLRALARDAARADHLAAMAACKT